MDLPKAAVEENERTCCAFSLRTGLAVFTTRTVAAKRFGQATSKYFDPTPPFDASSIAQSTTTPHIIAYLFVLHHSVTAPHDHTRFPVGSSSFSADSEGPLLRRAVLNTSQAITTTHLSYTIYTAQTQTHLPIAIPFKPERAPAQVRSAIFPVASSQFTPSLHHARFPSKTPLV